MARSGQAGLERWRFGPFELIAARGRLLRGGEELAVPKKSYDLLVHLVRHRDRVVPRAEIFELCWPDVVVSEAAFASVVRDLRRALGETGQASRFVSTIRGRGLRFVHPVEEVTDTADPTAGASWVEAATHFERALRALDLIDQSRGGREAAEPGRRPRERSELVVALARARWAAGATAEARGAFLDAARAARASGDAELLARAALGFAGRTDATLGVNQEAVELLNEALVALGKSDSLLRAEVLARLGTELYYDPDPDASTRNATEGLAMAERLGDDATTAYAATACHFTLQRPEIAPQERAAYCDRALELCGGDPPSDVLALALQEKLVDAFEAGDRSAFDEAFRRYEDVVQTLGQPFFHWMLGLFRGNRALLAGDFGVAEQLAEETVALGLRIGSPNATAAFSGQLFALREQQRRLPELEASLAQMVENGAPPIFRVGLVATRAAGASPERARSGIEEIFRDGLGDFPRDMNWLATLGALAPAVAGVGTEARVRQLVELLQPFGGRMIVVAYGAATLGAVDHHLGRLHQSLHNAPQARDHFDRARALHARMKTRLWEGLSTENPR